MGSVSSMPWLKIMDFLAEVGAAENETEFVQQVIQRIGSLVPFDLYCVLGVHNPQGELCPSKTLVENAKWFNYFADYYWRVHPDVSKEKGINTKTIDWNDYRDTEYAADFLAPQFIRYSLGIHAIGKGYLGTLALNRSKNSPQFSEAEQRIMEFLQPHLSNFYRIFTRLGPNEPITANPPESIVQGPLFEKLTKREKEIVVLLCRGLSTPEICSVLFISVNTAYQHIKNIFTKLEVSSRTELVVKCMDGRIL